MKARLNREHSGAQSDGSLEGLQSQDESVRARAVRELCPCRAGWDVFEDNFGVVEKLKKDRSELVRTNALHVLQDAARMQSSGYPTSKQEVSNEMLRRRRELRFLPEPEGREVFRENRHARKRRR